MSGLWPRRWLAALLVGAGAFVFLAPFALLLLPNPGTVRVSSPEAAGAGTYAGGADEWVRLFPYAAAVSFPSGSPAVSPSAGLVVRTKSQEAGEDAMLTSVPSGVPVPVRRDTSKPRTIRVVPLTPLPVGRYQLAAPRGGLEGGTDYYYFSVATSGS